MKDKYEPAASFPLFPPFFSPFSRVGPRSLLILLSLFLLCFLIVLLALRLSVCAPRLPSLLASACVCCLHGALAVVKEDKWVLSSMVIISDLAARWQKQMRWKLRRAMFLRWVHYSAAFLFFFVCLPVFPLVTSVSIYFNENPDVIGWLLI